MLSILINFLHGAVQFSLLEYIEAASLAFILYYIYTKTRTLAIIGNLFPKLNLNINYYRSSLWSFKNVSRDFQQTTKADDVDDSRNYTLLSHGIGSENMLENTPYASREAFSYSLDWGVYFPYLAQCIRSKKFSYVQVSPFVRRDPILLRAIKQSAEQILRQQKHQQTMQNEFNGDINDYHKDETTAITNSRPDDDYIRYQEILNSQERRAITILKDMRSTINNILLSITSWLLYKLLPCFLSGVVTHRRQIEMLKIVKEKAPGIPLIFLPLHRSHLDYMLVSFILNNNDIRSPLVAAGNNLQIPVFGRLLRGLGAFFIKRKIDPIVGKKDILYRAVLQLYLQHALKLGHNVEFFIEGGRTRTGKPCMPKGGILSVIVNAYMEGNIPDALLVPVSVNYERLVDGNFVREQRGEKKEPESFGKAISGIWKTLNSKYGSIRIDFNEPYSIKTLVESYNRVAREESILKVCKPSARVLQHNQSTSSLYGTDVVCEEHRNLIDSISRQVVFDCTAATSVMSTNALAFLLLTQHREGAADFALAKCLDELCELLRNQKDLGFSGESIHIINYAADLLGETLIRRIRNDRDETVICVVDNIDSWIELAYYANTLTPYFVLESILVITFHSLLLKSLNGSCNDASIKSNNTKITRKKLIEAALENCEMYRYEYILNKPTETLDQVLEIALDKLINRDLILVSHANDKFQTARKKYLSTDNIDEDEFQASDLKDSELQFAPNTVQQQKALCAVLAPYGYAYSSVAQSLSILYQNSMLESEFIKYVIKELTRKVTSKDCVYAESISTDSVKNCLKLLEKWSVVEVSNQSGLRLLTLGALYETSRDSIRNIKERILNLVPIPLSNISDYLSMKL